MSDDISKEHDEFMVAAIEQAKRAESLGDVPIGAVIVREGKIFTAGHNRTTKVADPTAHAEMVAIRQAAERLGDWRLSGCTMVVTLEPCCMCAGAIVAARIDRLIYGAADPKAGAVESLYQICSDERLNHKVQVHSGLRAEECGQLLSRFFEAQRKMGKK